MTDLLHKELTRTIIGVYYDVYNGTSRTYPEFIYEKAMRQDLLDKGVSCQRQPEYEVYYKGKLVGAQRLDLFVAGEVAVEIKVVPEFTRLHKAQTLSYLKVVNRQIGILCNFGSTQPEFERFYFHNRPPQNEVTSLPKEWPQELLTPELTQQVISGLYEVHNTLGPGFIYRLYANAAYHELRRRLLAVQPRRTYEVVYRRRPVGAIKFEHLQIASDLMVFPVAIQDINDVSINNLKAWLHLKQIPLGILVNFYPTSLEFLVLRS